MLDLNSRRDMAFRAPAQHSCALFREGGNVPALAAEDVATAYRNDFHLSLHPDLSDERVEFLRVQKELLRLHGLLEHDIDREEWIDRRPLDAALRLRS